jgi:hypothetical protein
MEDKITDGRKIPREVQNHRRVINKGQKLFEEI